MSDLSVLSHVYAEWNAHLGAMNRWLLSVRKMKDGYELATKCVQVPEDVRSVLADIASALDPDSKMATSAVPLSIKRKLVNRLEDQIESASHRLSELLRATQFSLDDLSDEDIVLLRAIVATLDDEVTYLYSRMRNIKFN